MNFNFRDFAKAFRMWFGHKGLRRKSLLWLALLIGFAASEILFSQNLGPSFFKLSTASAVSGSILLLTALFLCKFALQSLQGYLQVRMEGELFVRLQRDLITKLHRVSFEQVLEKPMSEWLFIFSDRLHDFVDYVLTTAQLIVSGVLMLSYLGLILYWSSQVGAILVAAIGAMAVVSYFINKRIHFHSLQRQNAVARMYKWLEDQLRFLPYIKLSKRLDRHLQRHGKISQGHVDPSSRIQVLQQLAPGLGELSLLVLLFAVQKTEMLSGAAQGGIILSMLYVVYRFQSRFSSVISSVARLGFLQSSFQMISEILSRKDESAMEMNISEMGKSVEVRDIEFSYKNISSFHLRIKSLNLPTRGTVGFMGSNGSGKSTLLALLAGLLKPQKGTVQWPGAFAGQMVFWSDHQSGILGETLAWNFCESDQVPAKDLKEKLEVLRLTGTRWLQFQQNVSENLFSHGELKKMEIIRGLLLKPRLIVLDEALDGLDQSTIDHLFSVFKKMDSLVLISSHNPAVIRRCELSIPISGGQNTLAETDFSAPVGGI